MSLCAQSVFGRPEAVFLTFFQEVGMQGGDLMLQTKKQGLCIKNLSITHKKDLHKILDNFSFVLNTGDKAVIISEEGNGKSTLLKLIYNEELVEDYVEYSGEILKGGLRMGYLPQEFPSGFKELSIYEYVGRNAAFWDCSPKELSEISHNLHFPKDLYYSGQTTGTLSGGEKVKLQIACLMMENPDIYLLDEPSNDIDIDTLIWLEEFINTCAKPVIYVSHDETLIEHTANVIIHLEQTMRKTVPCFSVVRTTYGRYISGRQEQINRQEMLARNEHREYKKQMDKFRQIEQRVEALQNSVSRQDPHTGQLLKKKMKAVKSMEHRFDREKENMTQMPDYEKAIFVKMETDSPLPHGKIVLDLELPALRIEDRILSENIRLRSSGPEKICIIGKNGTGKTTLLKEIAARLLPREDIRAAYMPQDYDEMLPHELTPVDFLSETGVREEQTRIRTYLGSMRYTSDEMEHPICRLSGGQRAKLLFLKMSLRKDNVLILDEPTRNFSPLSGPVIREVLKNYNGCIISISHDRKYIEEVCNKVYELTAEGLRPVLPT